MPSEDARSLENLLDAAGRDVQPTHPSWQTLTHRLAQIKQERPGPRRLWWLAPPLALAAAAAALFLALWLGDLGPHGGQVRAETLPIEVKRKNVELTILSVAETEGETLYMPLVQKLGNVLAGSPTLAAYEATGSPYVTGRGKVVRPQPAPGRQLTGQALVKDHRLILHLQEGDNVVRFTDVAATIDPTSVRFVSHTDPEGTQVVEQNFEYDLVNADALLKRYLDKEVFCVGKDSQETKGYLASFDDTAIVLASAPTPPPGEKKARSTQSLARATLQAIRLNEVPADLLTRPTLVWKLRAKKAGEHDTTVSYLCGYVKWQADYVAVVEPGEGDKPDRLDLTGWVTIDNASGTAYPKAGLKLIAGDVNRMRDPWAVLPDRRRKVLNETLYELEDLASLKATGAKKEFVEKSFFEYHLYTLTAPSTVNNREIKQLNLLRRPGIQAKRRYVYDQGLYGSNRVGVELTVKNEKENGLGLPLPKGRLTLEQRDTDGETGLLGRVDLDHTAVKEELSLKYGFAFDVAGESRQISYQQVTPRHSITTQEMRVRNHKTSEVQVRAVARLGTNWTLSKASLPYRQHDFNTVWFDFALKPNEEQVITYTVEYQY